MKNLRSFLNLVFSIFLDLESGVYSLRTQETNRLADDQGPPKAGRAPRTSWSRPSIMFIPFFTRYCAVANELLCWFVRNSRLHWGEWPRETCSLWHKTQNFKILFKNSFMVFCLHHRQSNSVKINSKSAKGLLHVSYTCMRVATGNTQLYSVFRFTYFIQCSDSIYLNYLACTSCVSFYGVCSVFIIRF